MLDIDLGILGASRPAYERYAAAIHDEYCPTVTTDAIFRMGRLSFLRNALAMPRIYFGDETRARWEASARGNLAWEIDELVGQQGLLERGISAIRDI